MHLEKIRQFNLLSLLVLLFFLSACSGAVQGTPQSGGSVSQIEVGPSQLAVQLIQYPAQAQTGCAKLFTQFLKDRSPRSWISLVGSLRLSLPGQTTPCASQTEKFSQLIHDVTTTTKLSDREALLLNLATGTSPSETASALSLEKDSLLVNGQFFETATPAQQAILKALFCQPLGRAMKLVKTTEIANFHGSYAESCLDRQARHEYLARSQAAVGDGK
jgi:hypothetical protein